MQYSDKWAFVVGGSAGIGFSLANLLMSKGINVLLIARKKPQLLNAQSQLRSKFILEVKCEILSVDASDAEALNQGLSIYFEKGISPHYLLNCAGRALPDYFENITTDQVLETFKINVLTAWNSIKICLPHLKKSKGHILNTSSVAGFIGVFGYTDYSLTKFGLIGFSEALRSEMQVHGIKVHVLCPPDTDTPGFEAENVQKPLETQAISGNVKLMHPDKVAETAWNGMLKNRFMILCNFESKLGYWLKRFLPGLIYNIMQSDVSKVQKKKALS